VKSSFLTITRFVGFFFTIYIWRTILYKEFGQFTSLIIIIGGIVLVFPVVWIGRRAVDVKPTTERLVWITSFVHVAVMIFFGGSIIESIKFFQISRGMIIPLPIEVRMVLLYLTCICLSLTVINLALSGLGAPFAIALSKRLANRWMYRWTRNPMVLCTLSTLLAVGLYLQSFYFVLYVILLVTPALILILKAYEERELEIRFGASYLDYKAKTPFLWPRRPKS
jgi:protein-S-isoprenylcysteine O-methyltransferase Ste14